MLRLIPLPIKAYELVRSVMVTVLLLEILRGISYLWVTFVCNCLLTLLYNVILLFQSVPVALGCTLVTTSSVHRGGAYTTISVVVGGVAAVAGHAANIDLLVATPPPGLDK